MSAMATKLPTKPTNEDQDRAAQASIPVMLDPPLLRPHASSPSPEASASTFRFGSMPPAVDPPSPNNIHHSEPDSSNHLELDSDDEDVDEVLLVDSPPLLPRPGGSWAHSCLSTHKCWNSHLLTVETSTTGAPSPTCRRLICTAPWTLRRRHSINVGHSLTTT